MNEEGRNRWKLKLVRQEWRNDGRGDKGRNKVVFFNHYFDYSELFVLFRVILVTLLIFTSPSNSLSAYKCWAITNKLLKMPKKDETWRKKKACWIWCLTANCFNSTFRQTALLLIFRNARFHCACKFAGFIYWPFAFIIEGNKYYPYHCYCFFQCKQVDAGDRCSRRI